MSSPMPHQGSTHQSSVRIPAGRAMLDADLTIPEGAHGIVIFAHGSGSSRKSTRNRAVAQSLHVAGLATLLLDLLTMEEDAVDRYTAQHRFDIPLLASRLVAAIDWAVEAPETRALPIALFGASTGAAAALIAYGAGNGRIPGTYSSYGDSSPGNFTVTCHESPTANGGAGTDQRWNGVTPWVYP